MRPFTFDIDPANANAVGLADTNASSGTTFTLDGALTSGGAFTSADGLAHRLIITDVGASNQTTATYTITGTDADGIAQVEAIAGPGISSTVTTTSYFLTVTSVTIASPVATSTASLGTVDEVVSKILPLNYRAHEPATHAVDVTGTIDYTVQETQLNAGTPENISWFPITALTAKTADLKESGELHSSATRLVVNSYSSTAEIKWVVFQNEG